MTAIKLQHVIDIFSNIINSTTRTTISKIYIINTIKII